MGYSCGASCFLNSARTGPLVTGEMADVDKLRVRTLEPKNRYGASRDPWRADRQDWRGVAHRGREAVGR